ncbi:hypothetical protein Tco_0138040 [Tanacetum coccineum]
MIGSLMYLTSSRHDIMFVVCACARYQVNPKVSHLHAVKKGFLAYTDNDYAGASLDRKSTTGGCQFLRCRLISWQCKKQTVVANSTTEVEKEGFWIRLCKGTMKVAWCKLECMYDVRFYLDVHGEACFQAVLKVTDKVHEGTDEVLDGTAQEYEKYCRSKSKYAEDMKVLLIIISGKAKKSVRLMMEKLFGMELELILFWSTIMAKTINGEVQLHALVDGKKIIITESTVRIDLQLEDVEGVDYLPNSTIFEQLPPMGPKTTTWNEFSSTMASEVFDVSKIFGNMRRVGKGFSGKVTHLFPTIVVQNQSELGEGSAIPTDPHHTPTIIQSSTQPQKTQKPRKPKRKDTQVPQPSDPSKNVTNKAVHKELRDSLVRAVTTASSLEAEQDSDEDITLVNVQDDADNEMFDVNVLGNEEVFVAGQNENVVEEVVDAAQVSTAATTVIITTGEITLAQALKALKTSKPKVKGIVFQELSKSTTTTISLQQLQDKGKGIMIEEPVKPIKKKVQIMLDEEVATKLQAEFDEEERLAREKVEKEKEANIALIKT